MVSLSEHDKAVLNCVFNPNLPLSDAYHEELSEELKDDEENSAEVETTKKMELEAVKKAETGNLNEAIEILTQAITISPKRASLYNNRAQVYQLKQNLLEALSDLTNAIDLSKGAGKSGCQALCQRGLLHRRAGRIELAKDDFTAAARLGSQFAKSQLVEMNPYAALCNQMLRDVFKKTTMQ